MHLPAIVENAASSPNAAREAALQIRKFLAENAGRLSSTGGLHYNAIMLIRILVDHPGHTFARNIDSKFVATVKDLLRQSKNANVQRFMRETLDLLKVQRAQDPDLKLLLQMWTKEKLKHGPVSVQRPLCRPYLFFFFFFFLSKSMSCIQNAWQSVSQQFPPQQRQQLRHQHGQQQQRENYFDRLNQRRSGLPSVEELASRITEAKTTSKLLIQLVQSTPPVELQTHELVREFADRCQAASRSIQGYIDSMDPSLDENTLLTLIETNDELSVARSQYQHALLKARKAYGNLAPPGANAGGSARTSPSPAPSAELPMVSGAGPAAFAAAAASVERSAPTESAPPPLPKRSTLSPASPSPSVSPSVGASASPRYTYNSADFQVQNPFADQFSTAGAMEAEPSAAQRS